MLSAANLPAQYPKKEKELQLQLGMGACHIALVGYASDDARRCYEAAELLADELGVLEKKLKVHFGLEAHYFMRGNFNKALEFAEHCHTEAQTLLAGHVAGGDNAGIFRARLTLAQANWAIGNVLFHQGDFKRSMSLLNQCIELCNQPAGGQFKLAHDPSIMSQLYCAWFSCEAGNLDHALVAVQQTLEQARRSGHVYTIGVALAFNACIHFFRNEFEDVIELASKSISRSEKPGFTTWFTWAKVLRGRALCESPITRSQGLNEIIEGLELWENSGAIVTRPFTLALMAESLLLCGRVEQANAHIGAARDLVDQFGERYYASEIYRISGRVVQQPPYENIEQARLYFHHALKIAGGQEISRSRLRAAIDLTTLQLNQGSIPEALDMLVQCRLAITGGEGTSDVLAADKLIASHVDLIANKRTNGKIIA
jgi:tetratricopeptide (TPR) repeat protein